MRPRRTRLINRLLILVAFGWMLAAGTAVARADTAEDYARDNWWAICRTLDSYDSVQGVEGVGLAIMDDGLTPAAAGRAIALAIIIYCPEHEPALQAFINKYQKGTAA